MSIRSATLAISTGTAVGLLTACGPPTTQTRPPVTPQPADRATPNALAVDSASPRSVASAFVVAWGSYDAVHDAPDAFAGRCRPYVTARLADELADDRPAAADWAAKWRLREVSVLRVAALKRPDGAPPPSARRVYLRVYADRVTTSRHGRSVTPTGVTVVLVHRDRRWLVDRVLFV